MVSIFSNRWVQGFRPRTLSASVVPVFVGTALAYSEEAVVLWRFLVALLVSLCLQVATNLVNDYADGDRGSDAERTGPDRLVATGQASSSEVKKAALLAFLLAGVSGMTLVLAVGVELLVLGIFCMLAAWGYTGGAKPYGYLGLGELFVFVFFGLVATVGSFYIHTEYVSTLSWIAAIPVGALAVALMVTNNLRDIPEDTKSGKRTMAVWLGDTKTRHLYFLLIVIIFCGLVGCAFFTPWVWPVALVAPVFFLSPIRQVFAGAEGRSLIPVLESSARAQLGIGCLFACSLALG